MADIVSRKKNRKIKLCNDNNHNILDVNGVGKVPFAILNGHYHKSSLKHFQCS